MKEMEALGSGATIEEAIEDAKIMAENEFLEVIDDYHIEVLQAPKRGLFSSKEAIVKITFNLEQSTTEETETTDKEEKNSEESSDNETSFSFDELNYPSYNDLEQVIFTPLANDELLESLAWKLIADAIELQQSIENSCRYESETGVFGSEKSRTYFDKNNNKVMEYEFAKMLGSIERITIYTEKGRLMLKPTFPPSVSGTKLENYEQLTVDDWRDNKFFTTVTEERTSEGSRIGIHEFIILFNGEKTTVKYNTYGVLIPTFCGITNVLGFRGTIKAEKWANELNSQFM